MRQTQSQSLASHDSNENYNPNTNIQETFYQSLGSFISQSILSSLSSIISFSNEFKNQSMILPQTQNPSFNPSLPINQSFTPSQNYQIPLLNNPLLQSNIADQRQNLFNMNLSTTIGELFKRCSQNQDKSEESKSSNVVPISHIEDLPSITEIPTDKANLIIRVEASHYESLDTKDYGTLQKQVKQVSKKLGFTTSQDTGLKKKKYAYFYCENSKVSSKFYRYNLPF